MKKEYSKGHTSLIKRHFSTFKDTMKTVTHTPSRFPLGKTHDPFWHLILHKAERVHQPELCGGTAWTREGRGVPDRLSSRVGIHTQVEEIATVMLTPKKLGEQINLS